MKLNKKVIISIMLVMIPIIIICGIILGRKIITPSNEDILNGLKNIKMYSCDVSYTFKNIRDELQKKQHSIIGLIRDLELNFKIIIKE